MKKYEEILKTSLSVNWEIDEVFNPKTDKINLDKNLLPQMMFGFEKLDFLSSQDKIKLNQIMTNSYFSLFGLIEDYIIRQISMLAASSVASIDESSKVKAYIQFSQEEVKHQLLFQRYCDEFQKLHSQPIKLVAENLDIAKLILEKSDFGVMLLTFHLEVITQDHYLAAEKYQVETDPLVLKIFKYHWLEEIQHAKLDRLKLVELREQLNDAELAVGFEDYLCLLDSLSELLIQQAKYNVETLSGVMETEMYPQQKVILQETMSASLVNLFINQVKSNSFYQREIENYSQKFRELILGYFEKLSSERAAA